MNLCAKLIARPGRDAMLKSMSKAKQAGSYSNHMLAWNNTFQQTLEALALLEKQQFRSSVRESKDF